MPQPYLWSLFVKEMRARPQNAASPELRARPQNSSVKVGCKQRTIHCLHNVQYVPEPGFQNKSSFRGLSTLFGENHSEVAVKATKIGF